MRGVRPDCCLDRLRPPDQAQTGSGDRRGVVQIHYMSKDKQVPPPSAAISGASGQAASSAAPTPMPSAEPVPLTGRRPALRNLAREMTDEELSNSGVVKLMLDELEQSVQECADLRAYVEKFHDADKRAAILEERVRPATAIEVAFGVGVGLGGAVLGLAPFFWDKNRPHEAVVVVIVGMILMVGATTVRVIKR